jgi:hypothetical protein
LTNQQELLFADQPATTYAGSIQSKVEINFCPADLQKIISDCNFLNTDEKEKLYKLLAKFSHLFGGTLGNGRTG